MRRNPRCGGCCWCLDAGCCSPPRVASGDRSSIHGGPFPQGGVAQLIASSTPGGPPIPTLDARSLPCRPLQFVASMDPKSSAMPVNSSEEGMVLKEGKDLEVKCNGAEFSGNHNKKLKSVTDSAVQSTCEDFEVKCNGIEFSGKHNKKLKSVTDSAIQSTGNEPARTKLLKVCSARGWKEPSYEFEEQGPPHNKLFTCKVTVHVEGPVAYTVLEGFSEPKAQKKAAQEHAARGALWCLAHYGHVK